MSLVGYSSYASQVSELARARPIPRTCLPFMNCIQCSPANPERAGEEAVGLADLSGLPSSFCVLVGE